MVSNIFFYIVWFSLRSPCFRHRQTGPGAGPTGPIRRPTRAVALEPLPGPLCGLGRTGSGDGAGGSQGDMGQSRRQAHVRTPPWQTRRGIQPVALLRKLTSVTRVSKNSAFSYENHCFGNPTFHFFKQFLTKKACQLSQATIS